VTADAPTGTPDTTASSGEDEWEDGEWEDSSVGHKFKFRAPKGEAEQFKSRMMMRADYDKKRARYSRFEAEFGDAIESGYFDKVAPVYKAIDTDPILAQAVSQLYQQRMQNQPLNYAQPGYQPPAQVQTQYQPPVQEQVFSDDPYLQAATKPLVDELNAMRQQMQQVQQWTETQQQQYNQSQQAAQARQTAEQDLRRSHMYFAQNFPQEFTGDIQQDFQKLQRLVQYADQAGYPNDQVYGSYGRMLQAKIALDSSSPQRVIPATPSAAAQTAKDIEQQARAAAHKASQDVANGTVVGGGHTPEPKPPRALPRFKKDGTPLPVKQRVQSIASRLMQQPQQ
jgi:hypothetical protein